MANKFKGIRSFTSDEASVLGAGLGNYKMLVSATTIYAFGKNMDSGSEQNLTDVDYVYSIKALDGSATLDARSLIVDDLSKSGTYRGANHVDNIELANGNEIVGAFDKIYIRAGKLLVKVAKRI